MKTPKPPAIDIISAARCTGCGACEWVCPPKSITMELDRDGFYKPVVNRETCTDCGICQRPCPVIENEKETLTRGQWADPKVFGAWTKNDPVRLASSSGGIFSELAGDVLDAGGTVVGCVWDKDWTPAHILTRSKADVERMRGSKYVPSRADDVYKNVLQLLRTTKEPVLFSGAPCQVAAMAALLKPEWRKRVLLVDFICHGVPSLTVFRSYLKGLFHGEAVASYTFRDKAFHWQTVRAESVSGKRHHLPAKEDPFFIGFCGHHLYLMEACHNCEFATLPRIADVTLADFWGCPPEWNDKRGVSLLLASSPQGLEALEKLEKANRIELKPTDPSTTGTRRQLTGAGYPIPKARRAFLDDIARGLPFETVKNARFPSRLDLWLNAFRQSDAKISFLLQMVGRVVSRCWRKMPFLR